MNRSTIFKIQIISFLAKILQSYRLYLYRTKGYDIGKSVILERNLNFDRLNPRGIHINSNTLIASHVTIVCHDHCKRVGNFPYFSDVNIGKNCFIAIGAIILPGVTIGDEVIVGAGSVVTKSIPSNCIVAGNPARIIRSNIRMNNKAELINWSPTEGWT